MAIDSTSKTLFISNLFKNINTLSASFNTSYGASNFLQEINNASVYNSSSKTQLLDTLNKATLNNLQFSMAQWRYLATMTVLRERLALTDGSYNELIKAMFGYNPRWHNHNAIYLFHQFHHQRGIQ